jgi:hypothetical protein
MNHCNNSDIHPFDSILEVNYQEKKVDRSAPIQHFNDFINDEELIFNPKKKQGDGYTSMYE